MNSSFLGFPGHIEAVSQAVSVVGTAQLQDLALATCVLRVFEDVPQAEAAARQGAQIIAVIRSTAQSLLDYVPEGATTKGFGGTFATA